MADLTDGAQVSTEEKEVVVTPEEVITPTAEPIVEPVVEPVTPVEPAVEDEGSEDGEDDFDENEPISLKEARKIRSENSGLRRAKKALSVENESMSEKLKVLETKVAEYETKINEINFNNLIGGVKEKFGLNDSQAKFLTGSTIEELEESAKEVCEAFSMKVKGNLDKLHTAGSGKDSVDTDFSNLSPDERRKMVRSRNFNK
jgi:hypothetical protein